MRSTCYNFAAVTQAHKEIAKKQGLRPPRVTRFGCSPQIRPLYRPVAETTTEGIQLVDNMKIGIIPDQTHAQASMAVSTTHQAIRSEQGILDGVATEEPFDMPYQPFNLPSKPSRAGKRVGKDSRPSLKLKKTVKPAVSPELVEYYVPAVVDNEAATSICQINGSVSTKMSQIDPNTSQRTSTNDGGEDLTKTGAIGTPHHLPHIVKELVDTPNVHSACNADVATQTAPERQDAVKSSDTCVETKSSKSFTLVVSDVEDLQSITQGIASVSPKPRPDTMPVELVQVAKESSINTSLNHEVSEPLSMKYTGFNIPKPINQQRKSAKAARVSLKPIRRQSTSKSVELALKHERSPPQPKHMNRSQSDVAQSPSVNITHQKQQDGALKETKTVVSLVSLYISFGASLLITDSLNPLSICRNAREMLNCHHRMMKAPHLL